MLGPGLPADLSPSSWWTGPCSALGWDPPRCPSSASPHRAVGGPCPLESLTVGAPQAWGGLLPGPPSPGGLRRGSWGIPCGAVLYLAGPWLLGHSGYICTEAGSARAGTGFLPAPRQNLIALAQPRAPRVGRSVVGADGRQLGTLAAVGRAGQHGPECEPGGPGQQPRPRPRLWPQRPPPACAPQSDQET